MEIRRGHCNPMESKQVGGPNTNRTHEPHSGRPPLRLSLITAKRTSTQRNEVPMLDASKVQGVAWKDATAASLAHE